MNDLSQRMEVKLPAASQIVDRLVKRGMVERHNDPNDRRVVRVELTPAARAMVNTLREKRDSRMRATLENLDRDEVEQVIAGLRLLGVAAETLVASERAGLTNAAADESASGLAAFPQRLSRVSIEGSAPIVSPNS